MKLENKYSESVIGRGKGYLSSVKYCIKINNFIYGKVESSTTYKTEVDLDSLDGDCSCPYGTNCKHAVALYLTYQEGKFWDAEDFIKSLNKMSSNELKELILSKLKDNPEWIIKHNIRKNTNTKDFIKSFKKSFSSDKVKEAEALLPNLSFEKLLELKDHIDNNYDELAEKLGEKRENEGCEYWDDESYDKELFELNEKLAELLVKQSLEKNKTDRIIKRDSFRDEIISNAESFMSFKEKIKKAFSKKEYLEFLLNLKNPDIFEIKSYVDDANKGIIYGFINEKPKLIKSIAKTIKDQTLVFSVAVYEKDFDTIIKNFNQFENAIKEDYEFIGRLSDIVNLFIKNKFKDEEIAKRLLSQEENVRYDKKQICYLTSQIKDFEFIMNSFDASRSDEHVALLERLSQLDKQKTLKFISERKELLKRHWSDIIVLFSFLKKVYDQSTIKEYIEKNQDLFKTSSHLKKHLKEECGIFISQREGKLLVEIK